jgi:hypothetical protein
MRQRSALANDETALDKNQLLQRIARYLMLHGSFTENIGLLTGKTGIAIFFYHYARYTGKRIYNDFAGELIDEIYKEIHVNTPLNFNDGLCGIAWGIEYMIRNKFIDADPDEVLEELDKKIMEWDVRHIRDYSLKTGLAGIACYIVSRMVNRKKEYTIIPPDYICDLVEALKRNKENANSALIDALDQIVKKQNDGIETLLVQPLCGEIFEMVDKIRYNTEKIFEPSRSLGIDKAGYAGIGLKLMKMNEQ